MNKISSSFFSKAVQRTAKTGVTGIAVAVSFALVASLSAEEAYNLQLQPQKQTVHFTSAEKTALKRAALEADQAQQSASYIVVLNDVPMVRHAAGQLSVQTDSSQQGTLNLRSIAAREYGAFLNQQQQSVRQQVESSLSQARITQQFTTALNGLVVASDDPQALHKLRKLPNVKQVFKNEMRTAQMDTSIQAIGADRAWDAVGGSDAAGAGIRVAVIDTGIRPENPMFAGTNMQAPQQTSIDDYCQLTDATFCTDKIITARAIPPTFAIHKNEYLSPLDYDGHGTHVAGTAVGESVNINYQGGEFEVSGVAPAAYLMVYKALYTKPDGKASGSDQMLIQAIEDAVRDGADVINNSWGGGPGSDSTDSVYGPIFADLEAAGIVVVTAAGNDGPGEQTVGCPGCVEPGITVAAANMGREFVNYVTYNNQKWLGTLGTSDFELTEAIQGELVLAAHLTESDAEGCTAYADNLTGQILYVERGTCTFVEKAEHALAAGAIALVVGNNEAGTLSMDVTGVALPSIAISKDNARTLVSAHRVGDQIKIGTTETRVDAVGKNRIASFSARGPNGDSRFLKPDLSAPGYAILSATSPDAAQQTFALNNGTSMATPQVAGAAAVLKAEHPDWSAQQIKSALIGTAQHQLLRDTQGEAYANAFAQGSGLVQVDQALNTEFSAYPTALVKNDCRESCQIEQTFENLTNTELKLQLNLVNDSNTLIEVVWEGEEKQNVAGQTNLTLPAKGKKKIKGRVDSRYAEDGWNFLTLAVEANNQTQHFPVVLSNERAKDASVLFSEMVTGEPSWGSEAVIETYFRGTTDGSLNQFLVALPKALTFDTVEVIEKGAQGNTQKTASNIEWEGTFQAAGQAGSIDKKAQRITSTLKDWPKKDLVSDLQSFACSELGGCDELAMLVTGLEKFNGLYFKETQYEEITVWSNGLIAFGAQQNETTFVNQALPSPTKPNTVLAPLWADFALGGDYSDGDIYFALAKYNQKEYFVVEWHQAHWFDENGELDSTQSYTFSVWIEVGTADPDIFYSYPEVSKLPKQATIGFEDRYGTQGLSYYYNNQSGSRTVSSGDALQVSMLDAESEVRVRLQINLDEGQDHQLKTDWNTRIEQDLVTDITPTRIRTMLKAEAIHPEGYYYAQTPVRIEPTGAIKADIVDYDRRAGLATIIGGKTLRFVPNEKFSGTTEITYRLFDEAGHKTQTYQVTVQVADNPSGNKKSSKGSFNHLILLILVVFTGLRIQNKRRNFK